MKKLLSANQLKKSYTLGSKRIPILRGVDLQVEEGEFISIMGPSGSGKTTLLYILGCLDRPDQGSYFLNESDMLSLSDSKISWVRANWIGFVFQTFDLLKELNVFENVSLPFLYKRINSQIQKEQVLEAIQRVGLSHRLNHRPIELSGGEMQRVAIARALAIYPKLILADEPTGNLDSTSSLEILQLFQDLHTSGTTVVMVTHDHDVASISERILNMDDGVLKPS